MACTEDRARAHWNTFGGGSVKPNPAASEPNRRNRVYGRGALRGHGWRVPRTGLELIGILSEEAQLSQIHSKKLIGILSEEAQLSQIHSKKTHWNIFG